MRVLVTVASRHGATREIGDAIAEVLCHAGHQVELAEPEDVETLEGVDAVVLGSAVYVGRWAASARAMVDRLAHGLSRRPVWLFSSGPVGAPLAPQGDAEEIPSLMARLEVRGHRTFGGRLDLGGLGIAERAVVALVRAEEGDYRPWPQIEDWARLIAADLHQEEARAVRLVR
ncbi:flavodoxin domain-containing protein [Actinotalea sp. C106]|uniref:flavodoxin domain-containing protein n=1 Tax=Actinotalea sp. C106 TaxID=2908644 RepID=UPI002027DE60|nr:flavodoxin domain-containing protein [Actinotalea sp. C106]